MIFKSLKVAVAGGLCLLLLGAFFFGRDLTSYARTSASSVRDTVKDNVPIEFELQRANDMLQQIIPEMHANIRMIAREEVELKDLKKQIEASEQSIGDERSRLARLRSKLDVEQASYSIGGRDYSREQVRDELSHRLDRLRESEVVLASKKRVLEARERSLSEAIETLERTRSRKDLLKNKIAGLEAQHRLVQASATGSGVEVDRSKLAQTEQIIGDIRKRLDVAERVMAREAHFVQPMEIDAIDEHDLLAEVDAYLENGQAARTAEIDIDLELDGAAADEATAARSGD